MDRTDEVLVKKYIEELNDLDNQLDNVKLELQSTQLKIKVILDKTLFIQNALLEIQKKYK